MDFLVQPTTHGLMGSCCCVQTSTVVRTVVAHLVLGWHGPRYCSTAGSFSTVMWPNVSIPQGDPASPCVLSLLLRPWHALMRNKHREIAAGAYYDNRSLKSTGGQAALNAAVAQTNRFDTAVGLRENFRKRQTWEFFSEG